MSRGLHGQALSGRRRTAAGTARAAQALLQARVKAAGIKATTAGIKSHCQTILFVPKLSALPCSRHVLAVIMLVPECPQ